MNTVTTTTITSNILFIDDDPQVLRALELSLRKESSRWRMVFARGAENAFTALQRLPFHVVVSDMRMPGTDGAGLLGFVRQRYPNAKRIVLSGHAERAAVERALAVAHAFLSKPCSSIELRNAIDRVLRES
jgi:DNA-binding NtrC family response regulator